jgi:hypothetical protein
MFASLISEPGIKEHARLRARARTFALCAGYSVVRAALFRSFLFRSEIFPFSRQSLR